MTCSPSFGSGRQLPHGSAAEIVLIRTRLAAVVARAIERAAVEHELALRNGGAAFGKFPEHLVIAVVIDLENRSTTAEIPAARGAGSAGNRGAIDESARLVDGNRRHGREPVLVVREELEAVQHF